MTEACNRHFQPINMHLGGLLFIKTFFFFFGEIPGRSWFARAQKGGLECVGLSRCVCGAPAEAWSEARGWGGAGREWRARFNMSNAAAQREPVKGGWGVWGGVGLVSQARSC